MTRKGMFEEIFQLLQESIQKAEQFENEKEEIWEKDSTFYTDEWKTLKTKEASDRCFVDSYETGQKIVELLKRISEDVFTEKLDMSSQALNNALLTINLTEINYNQQIMIAESFKGDMAALELLKSAFLNKYGENGKSPEGFEKFIVDPGDMTYLIGNVQEVFPEYHDASGWIPRTTMSYEYKRLADKIKNIVITLGVDISEEKMKIVLNEKSMEQVARAAMGL